MSKSRNEKKPPVQPPPVPATNDIIPGKFNENQWNSMIEQETGQDFVLDIVDEIVDCTIKVIYDKYIQSQLNPYSIEAAKDLLLQIIESRFLAHDNGDEFPENDTTWLEDEEPIPCITDSWSQGSVPVQRCPSRPLSARSDPGNYRDSLLEMDLHHQTSRKDEMNEVDDVDEEDQKQNGGVETESLEVQFSQEPEESRSTEILPSPPPPICRSSSPSARRKPGVKSKGKRRKQCSNKERFQEDNKQCENEKSQAGDSSRSKITASYPVRKIETGRAPADQEVTFDEQGNIIAMMRLSTDKLPTHRVRTRYNIIDAQDDHLSMLSNQRPRKLTAKESVLNQLRDTQGSSTVNIKTRRSKQPFNSYSFKSNYSLEIINKEEAESVQPLPPPLVDSMNISAGVVIREGQVVRKGPEMHLGAALHQRTKQDILNLQPVGSLSKKQSISVSDVIGTTSPVIRPIRLPEPIPPIASYHRS